MYSSHLRGCRAHCSFHIVLCVTGDPPEWYSAQPAQPYRKTGGWRPRTRTVRERGQGDLPALVFTQAGGWMPSLSGAQDHASPQTLWVLCACRPRSRIFQGVRSAGCLAGATPTPATVSHLPGLWVQKGCGDVGRYPSQGEVSPPPLATWQCQPPFPLASSLDMPRGPSLPFLRTAPEFPLNPGRLLLFPLSQECQALSIQGVCVSSTPPLHSQPPSLTDPCPLAQLPP